MDSSTLTAKTDRFLMVSNESTNPDKFAFPTDSSQIRRNPPFLLQLLALPLRLRLRLPLPLQLPLRVRLRVRQNSTTGILHESQGECFQICSYTSLLGCFAGIILTSEKKSVQTGPENHPGTFFGPFFDLRKKLVQKWSPDLFWTIF